MKWTTANVKNPNYKSNHEIYVGTHTGSFKKLVPAYEENPFVQKNLQDLSQLEKDSRVTALAFGSEEQAEILIGRAQNTVQVHSLRTEKTERAVEFQSAPIAGVARYNDFLIAGLGNGQVQSVALNDSGVKDLIFSAGTDIAHLRQCNASRNLVATGGKERQNNLKVFDLAADGKQLFTSKNLPNDFLQLEVPVWDSDVGFIDGPHTLATCSRYGYVRVYDTRKQRRPIQHFATDDQMSFTSLTAHGNYIYTGTTMGSLKAFDIRRLKTFVHTYKGFTGGISDLHLDDTGRYLTSASLDRYVRVHDAESTVLLYQCYVKSKATRVLIRESKENLNANETANANEEALERSDRKKTKNQSKSADVVDEEYEDMFENMQTIREKTDSEAENAEEEDDDEAVGNANEKQATNKSKAKKRKVENGTRKLKKKKN